jgi:acyl-CoA dehydrogenase
MEIELNEEQTMLRDTVRRFAAEVVAPRAREIDASGEFPIDYYHQAGELGLAGVCVPEGSAAPAWTWSPTASRSRRSAGSARRAASSSGEQFAGLRSPDALRHGRAEARVLAPLAAGKKLGCFALTEPDAGSNAAALKTTAKRDGDDYILNGSKVFITNGTHADTALVFATLDPALKHRGITAFIVAMDSPGFSRGHHEYKLGVQASGTTQLYFDNLRVPARQRLGDEGKGFGVAMSTLDGGRIGIAAQAVGIAQGAFEAALKYAWSASSSTSDRRLPGDPVLPCRHGMELDAARLLVYKAAWARRPSAAPSKRHRPSSSPPRWRSG